MEEPGVIGPPFNFTFQVRAKTVPTIRVIFCTGKLKVKNTNSNNLLLVVSQIQNLGYFPVRDLQLNIEIPEMSKSGSRFLQISDFYIDKVRTGR